jgi:hypothetical protein
MLLTGRLAQGCQMVYFKTKNRNFVYILEGLVMEDIGVCTFGLDYGHLIYFKDIWYILRQFGIFSPNFGILFQEKSGSPGLG